MKHVKVILILIGLNLATSIGEDLLGVDITPMWKSMIYDCMYILSGMLATIAIYTFIIMPKYVKKEDIKCDCSHNSSVE